LIKNEKLWMKHTIDRQIANPSQDDCEEEKKEKGFNSSHLGF